MYNVAREINARIVMSIYMQIVSLLVHHITGNHCSLKKFLKTFIISERSNCMNKASSVTDSYLQNFFFLSKSIYFLN